MDGTPDVMIVQSDEVEKRIQARVGPGGVSCVTMQTRIIRNQRVGKITADVGNARSTAHSPENK